MGDLNLDTMRPDKPEGKLLLDLEVEQCFECLITKPTRTGKSRTKKTNTLVEVLLSNRPELFQCAGNYYPCLSDHALIYGILKYKVNPNRSKVITFRSYKDTKGHNSQILFLVVNKLSTHLFSVFWISITGISRILSKPNNVYLCYSKHSSGIHTM